MYVCKDGYIAIKKMKQGSKKDANGINTQVECYFFDVEKCKHCHFKNGCYKEGAKTKTFSVKIKSDAHIKQMDYMETDEFKKLYSERYKIEKINKFGIKSILIDFFLLLFQQPHKRPLFFHSQI